VKGRSKGLIALFIFICFICVSPVFSSELKKEGAFEYRGDKIRDPFQPLSLIKGPSEKKKGKVDYRGYRLEELRLVGVIVNEKERFALMEDKEGKGIVLRKGDLLEEDTWVHEIERDKVVFAYRLRGEIKRIVIQIPR
jgi:Tfp pilus assembly protein PilP